MDHEKPQVKYCILSSPGSTPRWLGQTQKWQCPTDKLQNFTHSLSQYHTISKGRRFWDQKEERMVLEEAE